MSLTLTVLLPGLQPLASVLRPEPGWQDPQGLLSIWWDKPGACALHLESLAGVSAPSLEHAVLALAGHPVAHGRALPGAKCLFCNDPAGTASGAVVADPVSLVAERDHVRLIPAAALAITTGEAEALIETINALLAPDGLTLVAMSADSWRLDGAEALEALDTRPAHALAHRNLNHFLPRQPAARTWRTLFSECQMLLHEHPVNQARAARGQLPVNGVWFWGGAELPASASASASALIRGVESAGKTRAVGEPAPVRHWITDDAFTIGLAHLLGHKAVGLAQLADAVQHWQAEATVGIPTDASTMQPAVADSTSANDQHPGVECAVLLDRSLYELMLRGDAATGHWQAALHTLQVRLWQPALVALQAGQLDSIVIDDTEGQKLRITPHHAGVLAGLAGFWRRVRRGGR